MDIRALRYFVAVAETSSFSRAAERMGVVQSAISHQIRALEEERGPNQLPSANAGLAEARAFT